jgi:hypothetical protein
MADNITKVSKYLNATRIANSITADGQWYTFGFLKEDNFSKIVIEAVVPCFNNYNDGAYLYVEIDGIRKHTGVFENPNYTAGTDQATCIKQTWYGLTKGKKTVKFGWAALDGGGNVPWTVTHPNNQDDVRNPQTGSEWTIWEVDESQAGYGTITNPYLFPNHALLAQKNEGVSYFRTAKDSTRQLRWFKFVHGQESRVWVLVVSRNKNATDLFTTSSVNALYSDSSNHFKLSDSEIEYLTNKNYNSSRYGLAYFPALSTNTSLNYTRGLFANAQANLYQHNDWKQNYAGITVGWSVTDASSCSPPLRASATANFSTSLPPQGFVGTSNTNAYCGSPQILSNWADSGWDQWSARFNSSGGCSYCGENSGNYSDANLITSGGNYESYLHAILVS